MKKMIYLFIATLIMFSCKEDEITTVEKKSVGVFGASHSCYDGSEILRKAIENSYGYKVTSNGVLGSTMAYAKESVPFVIENAPVYDIYIIWSPTNDMLWAKLGEINSTDKTTHNGGLRYCFDLIKQKNAKAQILYFTMLPRFEIEKYNSYKLFIASQKQICEELNINYIDISIDAIFNKGNFAQFYKTDKIHLNNDGYMRLLPIQMKAFDKLINFKEK